MIDSLFEKLWPPEVLIAFNDFVDVSQRHSIALMFAVGLDCQDMKNQHLAIQLSSHTAANPNLAQMFDDVGHLLLELSEKFKAQPKPKPN